MKGGEIMNKKVGIVIVVVVLIIAMVFVAISITGRAGQTSWNQCGDRIDNDGDGKCDYSGSRKSCVDGSVKGDTGCSSLNDNYEASCVAGSTTCGVGACQRTSNCVNDQVSCTPGSPSAEVCGNAVDEDCDGVLNNGCIPDSCADSDGGQVYTVQGTTSGYKDNAPYSNTDSCLDGVTLIERYCSGVNSVDVGVSCLSNSTNGTTSCNTGRCV